MNAIIREKFQNLSEITLLNLIGYYAEEKGYTSVYFKSKMPKPVTKDGGFEIEYEYMHYVHLVKDEKMKVSIYYDESNLGSIVPEGPYYELYDRCDVERFLNTDEEEMNLFNRVKELI